MAFGAKVPGVTGGAGRGDLVISLAGASQLSVQIKGKPRSFVRLRYRELGDILPGEPGRPGERHVTRRAAGVGCRQVGSLDMVTIEAALSYGQANPHALTAYRVARLASQCRIVSRCAAHGLGMVTMGKAKIGSRRARRWPPLHSLFDFSVVTIGAVGCSRPELAAWNGDAGMAAGAAGKELTVLPVIEPLLAGLRKPFLASSREHDESENQAAEAHLEPARGRVRSARGRGVRSAPLPRNRVTLACRRVWFQSKPLASGRRRSSA